MFVIDAVDLILVVDFRSYNLTTAFSNLFVCHIIPKLVLKPVVGRPLAKPVCIFANLSQMMT